MIRIGYEVGTGKRIEIDPMHLVITGMTQQSGKTTTLEALLHRSDKKALVFKTKPGEKTNFIGGQLVAPFFKENSDWEYVASLLEATMRERMKFERPWIMNVCKGTSSLLEVKRNVDEKLADERVRGMNRDIYTTLQAYLQKVLPELAATPLANKLSLPAKINIMDLERLSEPVQSLIIRSCLETVLRDFTNVVVVMPEAWRIIPQDRGNPCKVVAESFVRQGATNGNFLWIDSQDVTGVDKAILKLVSTWILGLQSELNEVKRTINQMPVPAKNRPKPDEIMTLQKGQFFVCSPTLMKKVYVQPAWLDEQTAINVANGTMNVGGVRKPLVSDLPPIPPSELPQSHNEADAAAFRKEVKELREDLLKQVSDLFEYVKQFAARPPQAVAAYVDEDAIVLKVLSKIPVAPVNINSDEIVAEVLKRMPRGAGAGESYTVAPLEALKKQFLVETKEKIIAQIQSLGDKHKRLIKLLESVGKALSQKDCIEKAWGIVGAGGNLSTFREIAKELDALGFIRRDQKHGLHYPRMKEKIKAELEFHGGTEEDVEVLYNHIMASML